MNRVVAIISSCIPGKPASARVVSQLRDLLLTYVRTNRRLLFRGDRARIQIPILKPLYIQSLLLLLGRQGTTTLDLRKGTLELRLSPPLINCCQTRFII